MLGYLNSVFHNRQQLALFCLIILVGGGIWLCRKRWLEASLVGVFVLLLGMMTIPIIIPVRRHYYSEQSACINNLRLMDGAKNVWADEHHKEKTDVPTDADLFGEGLYMKSKPVCPSGGSYILGRVNEAPKCSLGESKGHKLE